MNELQVLARRDAAYEAIFGNMERAEYDLPDSITKAAGSYSRLHTMLTEARDKAASLEPGNWTAERAAHVVAQVQKGIRDVDVLADVTNRVQASEAAQAAATVLAEAEARCERVLRAVIKAEADTIITKHLRPPFASNISHGRKLVSKLEGIETAADIATAPATALSAWKELQRVTDRYGLLRSTWAAVLRVQIGKNPPRPCAEFMREYENDETRPGRFDFAMITEGRRAEIEAANPLNRPAPERMLWILRHHDDLVPWLPTEAERREQQSAQLRLREEQTKARPIYVGA
jgi:hypothetical protein